MDVSAGDTGTKRRGRLTEMCVDHVLDVGRYASLIHHGSTNKMLLF